MRHPAFYTDSDATSRKEASVAEQQKLEDQQLKQQATGVELAAADAALQSQTGGLVDTKTVASAAKAAEAGIPATSESSSTSVDLSKTPTQPVLSSQVQSKLSAATAALKSQAASVSSVANAEDLAKKASDALSSLCEPIYQAIDTFKTLPAKLRSLVDIDGAKVSMYSQLGKIQATLKKIGTNVTSVEVPITLNDYTSSPTSYPRLYAQQKLQNTITEGDCLSSGYTKTQLSVATSISTSMKDIFQSPNDQDSVGKTCDKMFSSTVKTVWSAMATPIQTVADIANIGPLGDMVQGVVDMVDGIVQIASTPLPEEQLNKKVTEHQMGGEVMAAAASKAADAKSTAKQTVSAATEAASEAASDISKQLKEQENAIKQSMANAFADMKMPPMPDGIDDSLRDLWDAISMVVANIQNIFIVALFKLLEAVFKCFNQILGVIGVPTLPYPLNILPTLITSAIDIMTFVMGLPMSLMNQVKAIVKRKVKATVVADLPTPPKPVEPIEPVPPTSEDVPNPEVTWDNVADALHKKWKFGKSDAQEIVENIQTFFDGSDINSDNGYIASTNVVDYVDEVESPLKEGAYDQILVRTKISRIKLTPNDTLENWLPTNIDNATVNGYDKNFLKMPTKDNEQHKLFVYKTYTKGKLAGQVSRVGETVIYGWVLKDYEST